MDGQRLDKFLWVARFFRARATAAELCISGRIRVNSRPVTKPGYGLKVGDVLVFPQAGRIRMVRVQEFALRRGAAAEAARLYEDLAPAPPDPEPVTAPAGPEPRPDPRARRAAARLRGKP